MKKMYWKPLTVTVLCRFGTGCKLDNEATYNLLSVTLPYNIRLKSSIRKKVVLKKKFSFDGEEIVETKLASSVMKKLNWENNNLFGNLIKPSAVKKLDFDIGCANIESKKMTNVDKNEIFTTVNKSVVHKIEHGYKDLDDIDYHKTVKSEHRCKNKDDSNHYGSNSIKHELKKSCHPATRIIKEPNVQNKSQIYDYPGFDPLFSSEEIKAENMTENSCIEPSVKQIAISSDNLLAILEFPLVNKWRTTRIKVKSEVSTPELDVMKQELELLCGQNSFPSVTSILNKTMPFERVAILEQWKLKMIEEMGEEAFKQYQQDILSHGSSLHQNINTLLSGSPETELIVQPFNAGHWQSLKSVLPTISDVKLLEEHVTHPFLMYKGVIDCLAQYRNHLVVIDWKTSKKQKSTLSSTYDSPLQVAAYLGALNFDPKFQHVVNKGLLVVAYEDGSPGHAHLINSTICLKYWKQWLKRLKLYWKMVKEKQ